MKIVFYAPLVIVILLFACNSTSDPVVVDDPQDTLIQNLIFFVDTTYLDSNAKKLVSSGRVKNGGNSKVTSPWYVEGVFYTTKTSNVKLGGANTRIGVSLNSNQETIWTLYFTSSNVDVRNYPDFGIKDFRGVYKN
ncbi:MAG: hypothetical protein N3D80_10195 [Ignavibacterium album]|uniref:hypothetical protein n=1 Tax=Ignavibacterium album TaxID=591197 RepID=UPI0026E937C9|nr:hypothetical protein [Ignavibacterium album]MCX8106225.1 hypothetical protein [Ignavibacterium album]